MDLAEGVRSLTVEAGGLRMHALEAGPDDGVPVVLVHGNLSTGRFFEPTLVAAPAGYHFLAPDMRGFGDTERAPIDALRGLGDWGEDVAALLDALGIAHPPHLLGWSSGAAAIARFALAGRAVASLTFVAPVSPFGYGGVHLDGTPCAPDHAGSGGGTANPEFVRRLRDGDRSAESPLSPRNVMNGMYWSTDHREPPEREDVLVDEILKSAIGDEGYPGDGAASDHWPGVAPGTRGILNALSPRYGGWAEIVDLDPKPPVLWTHGTADLIIADASPLEFGTLGEAGTVPGWPGADAFPPQPMVSQIRAVLDAYAQRGGRVETELFEGSGHFPPADAAEAWRERFFGFLDGVGGAAA